MAMDRIRETLTSERIDTKTLEQAATLGKTPVYKLSVPHGKRAVEAWLDLQHSFDDYWAIITGAWAPPIDTEPSEIKSFLRKARRLDGTEVLEQLKQEYAHDWKWFGDCPLADDGVPERLHGKWPKQAQPNNGFSYPWDPFASGRPKVVQMMLLPTKNNLETPALMGLGHERPGCPPPEIHVALLEHWNQTYGLQVFGLKPTGFEVWVEKPPTTRQAALQLAREQFFYCPQLVDHEDGAGTIEKLAGQLLKGHSWLFYWDFTAAAKRKGNTKGMSSQESWRYHWDKQRDSFKEILTWDLFEDWDSSRRPESSAENDLGYALSILYSGLGKRQAKQFLQNVIDVLERAFRENKFKSKKCKEHLPQNVAQATRILQYAYGLHAEQFDSDEVLEASTTLEKEVRKQNKKKWGEMAAADYLDTVRMALVCGDRALADERLKIKKSFKWHQQEFKLWKQIAASDEELPLSNAKLLAEFDAWFDDVRHAAYQSDAYMTTSTVRLEAAAIRYKYFVAKNGNVDWKQVVKQVTRQ